MNATSILMERRYSRVRWPEQEMVLRDRLPPSRDTWGMVVRMTISMAMLGAEVNTTRS